uniref:Ig-like domain-containing protein n=1 Tax=Cyprinus carpio TaxID=7962 RepID=A0A8C2H3F3_CYPCA
KLHIIFIVNCCHCTERPKANVTITPDQHVFRGETVTLRCDIDGEGVTSWKYSWYKDGSDSVFSELQEHIFRYVTESDVGNYSCYGAERGGSRTSNISDEVTLTVSDKAKAVLSGSPQKWLTEGDPVTLICEVKGSPTGWTFSWYTVTVSDYRNAHYQLLSDSSRGAGGNYTVSSAALNHTGVYVCTAKRGKRAYSTQYSNKQLIWVTAETAFPGVSCQVSLIVSPSRTQHFTSVPLSLTCEDQSNSHRWRVRRYSDSLGLFDCSSRWGWQTGSTCTISYTVPPYTGVYWCQSESGENSHPVNITVHPLHDVDNGGTPYMGISPGKKNRARACICQSESEIAPINELLPATVLHGTHSGTFPKKCVFGCKGNITYKPTNITKNPVLCKQWMQFVFPGQQQSFTSVFVDESFINKAQFDAGFAHRLILKDGAVPAINYPGHDSELQTVSKTASDVYFVCIRRSSARHSLAPPMAHLQELGFFQREL